jgi:thiol-disulfide isomerase/thioredoxin
MKDNIKQINMSKKVILFSGSWCKPCQLYKPTFNKVAASTPGIQFETVDVDSGHQSIMENGIRNVPTTVIVEADGTIRKQSGNMSEETLKAFIG